MTTKLTTTTRKLLANGAPRSFLLRRFPRGLSRRIVTLLPLLCLLQQTPVQADTPEGAFAVKGIGATRCSTFLEQLEQNTPNVWMYGGWVYGFVSSENHHGADTFDLVPWEDLGTLTNYLRTQCARNPDSTFADAVMAMVEALRPTRLSDLSRPVQVAVGDQSVILYRAVLVRMQQALAERGLLQGEADGVFGDATSEALRRFQEREGLDVTGLPDQFTLHRLFRGTTDEAPRVSR